MQVSVLPVGQGSGALIVDVNVKVDVLSDMVTQLWQWLRLQEPKADSRDQTEVTLGPLLSASLSTEGQDHQTRFKRDLSDADLSQHLPDDSG